MERPMATLAEMGDLPNIDLPGIRRATEGEEVAFCQGSEPLCKERLLHRPHRPTVLARRRRGQRPVPGSQQGREIQASAAIVRLNVSQFYRVQAARSLVRRITNGNETRCWPSGRSGR